MLVRTVLHNRITLITTANRLCGSHRSGTNTISPNQSGSLEEISYHNCFKFVFRLYVEMYVNFTFNSIPTVESQSAPCPFLHLFRLYWYDNRIYRCEDDIICIYVHHCFPLKNITTGNGNRRLLVNISSS